MCGEAVVVDDYAHNPAKLAAMWSALAAAFPAGVAVVWRPHGYGPLRKMLLQLAETFRAAIRPQDALLLLPVYDAGGTADRSVASEHLSAELAGVAGIVECVPSLDAAEARLRELAPRMGAVVTAGARDPGLPLLAKRLASA
jgi:UDP-N-acetylmuramate--alanine ligase